MRDKLSFRAFVALLVSKAIINRARRQNKWLDEENKPGRIALKICPNFLAELSKNVHSIVVTGTNGKTTTARFIGSILKIAGRPFFSNREGANLDMRIATLFADNYSCLKGATISNALLECDEGALNKVIPKINPDYIIITNIYSDQKSRFVSEKNVASMIYHALKNTKPSLCFIHKECHFKDKIETLLPQWKFIEYSTNSGLLCIYGREYSPSMSIPGLFNLENAAAASALSEQLEIPTDKIINGIEATKPAFGRFEQFKSGQNDITLTLAKNSQGLLEVVNYLNSRDKTEIPNLIVAINKGAGDDRNTEWLYEIPFKALAHGFQNIRVVGACVSDLHALFLQEGITSTKIAFGDIPIYTAAAAGGTFIIANYSAMMAVRYQFVKHGLLRPYWED